ncbi:MAG: carboxymuconolactone decarboxylase family protein [Bacteroidaceae bacterium]|nr:carboxymuconolactone decarboxylase family protein [Bacteroidaceae bacterium]
MAQNITQISPRIQALAAIASAEAKGDTATLRRALGYGLDNGLTVSEAKEALSQLYAYTGFPRSLNALGTLQSVLQQREADDTPTEAGREASPLPADYDALARGTEVQTRLTGRAFNYAFAPQTDYYLKAHLFGDIFVRDNLTEADREVVTVSAISALPGCEPQLRAHVAGARNMGVADETLRALPVVLAKWTGQGGADRLSAALAAVLDGDAQAATAPVLDSPWPIGEPNTAYAQYFIGQSYLAPLDAANGGPVNVTFEPRCRNNWHVHHDAVQVLVCVNGRGWYQEWGKPAIELKPGITVCVPAEVKHWHGAARDSWMQHLTYHTHVGPASSNEWLEPVTDEVYDRLP